MTLRLTPCYVGIRGLVRLVLSGIAVGRGVQVEQAFN